MAIVEPAASGWLHGAGHARAQLNALQGCEQVLGRDPVRASVTRERGRGVVEDADIVVRTVDPRAELFDVSVEGWDVADGPEGEMAAHDRRSPNREPTPRDDETDRLVNIRSTWSGGCQCADAVFTGKVETVKFTGDVVKPPVAEARLIAALGPNVHFALAIPCSSVEVMMGTIAPPPA